MISAAYPIADPARLIPQRYFNLFRLVIAGMFLVAGRELGLGVESPRLFAGVSLAYLGAVLLLGFPDAARRLGLERLIALQVVIDILALTAILWISGGYRSGMAVMMMVYLAAAGLVAEGRMVLFFAALATVLVLLENTWRHFLGPSPTDFLQIGIVCIGFFAIAMTSSLLARRAKANEWLAVQRGEALGRQQAVNERIIEDMQDGVVVLGADGRVRQANPRASALIGVELQTGMRLADLDAGFEALRRRGAAGSSVLERLGPAGKLLRCRIVGARGDDGLSGDTLLYLTDFEEIQKHIQQLKLAALGRLTASIAHEIRNPLSAVTQAADLLKEEKRGELQLRLVRIINDNARRIERMIRDVLALGRRDEMMPEALALEPFVATMIDELSLAGEAERAVFSAEIAPAATLAVDRTHLHQILGNLLVNARRYCSGTPGSVRLYTTPAGEGHTVLHVVDDGPGIEEAARAQVFEPFFTTEAKGTGLGLYIARELAEANDIGLELVGNEPGAHFVLSGRSQP